MGTFGVFAIALAYRVSFALLTCSTFVPDEYYQSVEPSYNLIYNTSAIDNDQDNTWEWHSNYQMRSYVSVLHNIIWFYVGKHILRIDNHGFVTKGPRVLQAIFTAVADTCLYLTYRHTCALARDDRRSEGESEKLQQQLSEEQQTSLDSTCYAFTAFLTHLFSWSCSYCLIRTIGNSTEASFCMVGSYFWIRSVVFDKEDPSPIVYSMIFKTIVFLSIYCRPSATLWWAPLVLADLCLRLRSKGLLATVVSALMYASTVVAVCCTCVTIDNFFYTASNPMAMNKDSLCSLHSSLCNSGITVPPVNFYMYNIHLDFASKHFGAVAPHWMVTEGLPAMLGLNLPLLAAALGSRLLGLLGIGRGAGLAAPPPQLSMLSLCSLVYLAGLACGSKHLELRFLLPALPPLHALVGHLATAPSPPETHSQLGKGLGSARPYWRGRVARSLLHLSWAVHVALALFLAMYHQSGVEPSLRLLAGEISTLPLRAGQRVRVLYAAPCYAFPHRSFLHGYSMSTPNSGIKSLNSFDLQSEECSPSEDIQTSSSQEFSPSDFLARHLPTDYLQTCSAGANGSNEGSRDIIYIVTFDAYRDHVHRHLDLNGTELTLVHSTQHAYFDYDRDDPLDKRAVLIFRLQG